MAELKHPIGISAKVEVWNYKIKQSEFKDCVITGTVNSIDREYRVNVILPDGIEFHECAPECVTLSPSK